MIATAGIPLRSVAAPKMAAQAAKQAPRENNEPTPDEPAVVGPPAGLSSIPAQYTTEQVIRQMMKSTGYDEAREDSYRLKGIQLIDNIRENVQLWVCRSLPSGTR